MILCVSFCFIVAVVPPFQETLYSLLWPAQLPSHHVLPCNPWSRVLDEFYLITLFHLASQQLIWNEHAMNLLKKKCMRRDLLRHKLKRYGRRGRASSCLQSFTSGHLRSKIWRLKLLQSSCECEEKIKRMTRRPWTRSIESNEGPLSCY